MHMIILKREDSHVLNVSDIEKKNMLSIILQLLTATDNYVINISKEKMQ